jgi:hypothetical protein
MVFTYNAGVGTLYKNGIVVTSKSGMTAPAAWTQFGNSTNPNMQAIIDDVRIYSRALSQDDITTLYNYNSTTTTTTTNIATTTAQSGGYVTSPNSITAYGVCYSATNQIPTLADAHTVDGSLTNSYVNFTSQLSGLNPSQTYYVCSYATQSDGTTFYGNVLTFKTLQNGIIVNTISIAVDCGVIPPIIKLNSKISNIGVAIDCGVIPPRNYFHPKISSLGISLDQQPSDSILYFQIL